MLGDLIRGERERRGLSMRETARRIGISAAYLVELEHGRNPTTGRAPVPSPVVLAGVERALGISMRTLLDLAGAPAPRSGHTLLVVADGHEPAAADAAEASGAAASEWIEIPAAGCPAAALEAAAGAIAGRRRAVGLVFEAGSAGLRADAAAVVAAEETWEADVAAACRDTGAEPAANVCVYREADLRAAAGADPLSVVLGLFRTHPRVAMQTTRGLTTGPAAIAAILAVVRPDAITREAWTALAAAAAAGLHRASCV